MVISNRELNVYFHIYIDKVEEFKEYLRNIEELFENTKYKLTSIDHCVF
jgi:hypothetical protein